MAAVTLNTVTGTIRSDQLGRVLAHEHVMVGWAGWEADTIRPGPSRAEAVAVGTDRIAAMKSHVPMAIAAVISESQY